MKKQIKELLNNNQKIVIKWRNRNTWITSFEGNCYELVIFENIKITKKGANQLKLTYFIGCHKVITITNLYYLEREILNLVAMKNQYLGDKSTISSRFGTRTINH
jgi:hypothetical protein